jgi:predicted TIM-barrel fold metal-dependent hydrolase/nitrite reductase/ring-hydroxylating ferredoxin subunit
MSDVIDRPILAEEVAAKSRLRIIDCDVHPSIHAHSDLDQFLPKRWQQHLRTYGSHLRTPYIGTTPYPRSSPLIARRDAWPPTGGPPGSDLDFMRKQHLDPLDVEYGILQVLDLFIFSQQNLEFGAAIQRAINDWQLAFWSDRDPRLKASILAGQDDTEFAIAEIERCAKIGRYVQINVCPRANEPLGRRRYWPIYARAQELGLPLGIHVGGYGGHAPTGGGWPSYYVEEHQSNAHTMAAQLTSLVLEGVPERFPNLKIVFIEGGFGWIPSATWRMDRHFESLPQRGAASQAPAVGICEGAFLVHDAADRRADEGRHLRSLIEWVGADRLLFSSDYPHWDFDDPRYAFRTPLTETERRRSSTPTRAQSTSSDRSRDSMARHIIARTSEIPPGGNKVVEINGRDIVVFHVNGEYFALLNRCPHAGAPLQKSRLRGAADVEGARRLRTLAGRELLRCAWHGWEFDMRNGQSWFDPQRVKIRTYPVVIEDGETLAKGPYVAETFPVHVEDSYVIVEA